MIDTIVLTIPRKEFRFSPDSGWQLHSKSLGFEKYVKNQTNSQRKDGIYRPRPRIIQRGRTTFLQVEFSVPKLIFGNNVEEVREGDFEIILKTLRDRLRDLGILLFSPQLRKARVSYFHPSKNILLSEQYTATGIIKELQKINLTKKMDLQKDSFRNDGQSLQCYTNSHSLAIYDKVADLKKPAKRAIDKNPVPLQLSLFKKLDAIKNQIEILRIEVRLSNKTKMNSILAKYGFQKNPSFEEIFKKSICQKIVEQYWKDLIANENLFLFQLGAGPKQTLTNLFRSYPKIKLKEAIYLTGLQQLSRDENGIRELRNLTEKRTSIRTWHRIKKDLLRLNRGVTLTRCHGWVNQVETALRKFHPVRIRGKPIAGHLAKQGIVL